MAMNEMESRKLVSKNVQTFLIQNNIGTQKDLAKMTNVSQAMITHILQEKVTAPIFPFLTTIREHGYSIDDFLFSDISKTAENDSAPVASNVTYDGVYQLYYYNDRGRLKSGVLLIQRFNNTTRSAKAVLLCNLNCEYASKCFAEAKSRYKRSGNYYTDAENNLLSHEHTGTIYKGNVTLSNDHINIVLTCSNNYNKMLMTFFREYSINNNYSGGLGTMSLPGESRTRSPLSRYVGLSPKSISFKEDEISRYLDLKALPENDHVDMFTIDEVLNEFANGIASDRSLTADDYRRLAKAKIEDIISAEVHRQLPKTFVVTPEKHEDWCEFISSAPEFIL